MADVRNEITPHRVNSSLLGEVVDEDENCACSQRSNPDPELKQFAPEGWPPNAHLLLASLSVKCNLFNQTGDLGHRDETAADKPERLAPSTRPEHHAIGTYNQRCGGKHTQDSNDLVWHDRKTAGSRINGVISQSIC